MTTPYILMIRPAAFAFNQQTSVNNAFQHLSETENVQEEALQEFDTFVEKLKQHNINVIVIQDNPSPHTPDSIFPNNWVSFHEDGTSVLYPMFAANRQQERNKQVIEKLSTDFYIRTTIDLTDYEKKNIFLEGTGSMVLDRDNELAYACLSPRTHASALYDFCNSMGYRPLLFRAVDGSNQAIYHTNVMMCMADEYVVICMDTIKDEMQQQMLLKKFMETGKEVVTISIDQMNHFAGNMLQVSNIEGQSFLIMSTQAFNSLTEKQVAALQKYNPIIHSPLDTIELNGGGSARCMMAEIFLPLKNQS